MAELDEATELDNATEELDAATELKATEDEESSPTAASELSEESLHAVSETVNARELTNDIAKTAIEEKRQFNFKTLLFATNITFLIYFHTPH